MRIAIVSSRDLDPKDWRPEHYIEPSEEEIRAAELQGWDGIRVDRLARHGRKEIRDAYERGREAAIKAREAFTRRQCKSAK